MAGSGSGAARLGVSQPAFPHEAPAATRSRSYTGTRTLLSCRNQAVASPTIPAPTTATSRGAPARDGDGARRRAAMSARAGAGHAGAREGTQFQTLPRDLRLAARAPAVGAGVDPREGGV